MGLIEIILIGIGLSMDAVAVSMTNGMVYKDAGKAKTYAMPILFGLFQGLMPLIGYFAGGLFADVISQYASILVFIILGFIGGKMLKDGIEHIKEEKEQVKEKQEQKNTLVDETMVDGVTTQEEVAITVEVQETDEKKELTYKMLFIQAIATSIDAFAVGIGFSAMQVDILPAASIITFTTAICSLLAIFIGKKFGDLLGSKSELLGGAILVFLAIKALF
ncbi:manganese efflux pump MntP family protein [Niameybacter massiliensis]|uniref:Putative manganese efflux pump MntP n=1 Tax=Holtiella tumoricola TaxID=3018743 RepID=A0AA42J0H1_9FIRM|nr:manganese efflux pump MntP family protein [Holtiella tumoricola]MDA3731148.1 manganese efflux pump MntP family protein [Holtiella tumoricola]